MTLRILPNLVTCLRLGLVPVLLAAALLRSPPLVVLGLMAFCFFTDLADGLLARWLNAASALGARLDSIADFTFYLSIPLVGWLVWPEILLREAWWFAAAVGSVVLPAAIAFARFRISSGYHTWLAKLSAFCMAAGLLALFALDWALLFRFAVLVSVVAALEEIAITLVLEHPRQDVRSLWHILRQGAH